MSTEATTASHLPVGVTREARERLQAGESVDCPLPDGRIYVDRPLPFLCVHRRAQGGQDLATRQLVESEGSWLVVNGDPALHEDVSTLVSGVLECLADRFGSVLLMEVWADGNDGFEVVATERTEAVDALVDSLGDVRFAGRRIGAEHRAGRPCPPGLEPLLSDDEVRSLGCLHVGVSVPGVYSDPHTGRALPEPLRELRRELSLALQRSFHAFAQTQTSYEPDHYRTMGRRVVTEAAWESDRLLSEVGASFDYLMAATPVNTQEAWRDFEASRYQEAPRFHYRLLDVDPERLKRSLYDIPIEKVPDPTLAYLFRDKRAELDRKITLLADRETERFLPTSLALYGGVDDDLHDLATRILAGIPAGTGLAGQARVNAQAFAAAARAELARYRTEDPIAERGAVVVRDDVPSLIVTGPTLLVSSAYQVKPSRVDALVQHEIGTHVLTYLNGAAQPLQQLGLGLAGYEQLQEGLGVFAEWLAGGLTAGRLRLLAARVIAVRRLIEERGFTEVFHELHTYGFSAYQAYSVTMRVFRSGGLTKDAVYLRGLDALLRYLADGGDLGILTIGKLHLEQVPLVEELRWREVLRPPPLTPAWLQRPDALERLDHARAGIDVLDLIEGSST